MGMEATSGNGKTVCVTGASGYLGSHLVKQLLQKGYTVNGTVRNAADEAKYGWIKALADGTPGQIRLFSADLLKEGSFDEAMEGCEYVCHVAAAVTLTAKDPMDIVKPQIDGTRNVFNSILKAKAAKRVALTSTIGAIFDYRAPLDHVFTEEEWHKEMSLKDNPYPYGKTLAERYAWEVQQQQQERAAAGEDGGWCFEMVSLNPSTILGELLDKAQADTSAALIKQMLDGSLPMAPDFSWPVVHVRDVALAHVLALENESARGRYVITSSPTTRFVDIAGVLRAKYPKCKAPKKVMPTPLLYLVAVFNPLLDMNTVKRNAGRPYIFSNAKAVKELGINFISADQAILDTAESLKAYKLVPEL